MTNVSSREARVKCLIAKVAGLCSVNWIMCWLKEKMIDVVQARRESLRWEFMMVSGVSFRKFSAILCAWHDLLR